MSLGQSLPPLQDFAPLLNKIVGEMVVVAASASNNTAKDKSVQVNGHVADSIQYT